MEGNEELDEKWLHREGGILGGWEGVGMGLGMGILGMGIM